MPKRGKSYKEAVAKFDKAQLHEVTEAMKLACETSRAKFDETIEAHIKLGVDGRHADQQVRGAIVLPNGTGKSVKVLVFAKGPKAEEAEKAGADYVGAEELADRIRTENCCLLYTSGRTIQQPYGSMALQFYGSIDGAGLFP